jgi:hypothetical protein
MTDAEELYAGVNPTNKLSGFDLNGNGMGGGGTKVTISWLSLSGRTYSIYRSTSLTQSFPVLATGIAATPSMNTYTDTPPRRRSRTTAWKWSRGGAVLPWWVGPSAFAQGLRRDKPGPSH